MKLVMMRTINTDNELVEEDANYEIDDEADSEDSILVSRGITSYIKFKALFMLLSGNT